MFMPLPAHLHLAVIHALALVPPADLPGVYAVSFLIYDEEDDPRRPTLTIGYNTEDRVRQALAVQPGSDLLPAGRPSDEGEARWNYAFWLQNELAVIGHSTRDPAGARLCEAWPRRSLHVLDPEPLARAATRLPSARTATPRR